MKTRRQAPDYKLSSLSGWLPTLASSTIPGNRWSSKWYLKALNYESAKKDNI